VNKQTGVKAYRTEN